MGADDDVPPLAVGRIGRPKQLNAGFHELVAHQDREQRTEQTSEDGEHQVHRSDVLVVRRIDEAPPAGGMMIVAVTGMLYVNGAHLLLPSRRINSKARSGRHRPMAACHRPWRTWSVPPSPKSRNRAWTTLG